MEAAEQERERCLGIVREEMEGAPVETRRVLTRIINRIRRDPSSAARNPSEL